MNFTVDGISYQITGRNAVEARGPNGFNDPVLNLPGTITINTIDFPVTTLDGEAFRNEDLTM